MPADRRPDAVSRSSVREVMIENLLRRQPLRLDSDRIAGYLAGKVVLVSGAGGSIGSEIVVQMARFQPRKVVLLGRGENSLFILERNLERVCPDLEFVTEVCDVRRRDGLDGVFRRHRPEVVFHAAAHKHVPLMEGNAWESVFNNVGGTANLLNAALAVGVQQFVNLSTDKAVNPASVMGATKRVAEYLVQQAARRAGAGEAYVSVRFGNVIGSRGSVIPLFQQQIRHGGPVTLTHPDMTRYFMTIPEAAQLVLQAGGMGGNGSVYVLDMGDPVKIVDLAEDLIRLSGLVPGDDIRLEFRGVRPGEKLFEELLTAEEGTTASQHERIFVAQDPGRSAEGFDAMLDTLFHAARRQDAAQVRDALAALVPTYRRPAGDVESEAAQPDLGWVRSVPRSA